jgi:CheY-like chemotaxis protein
MIKTQDGDHTILYIEDDLPSIEVIQLLLEPYQHISLLTAMTAEEGIIVADKYVPDLIFLDINLPKMSGRDAIKTLKLNPKLQNTLIIALSGDAYQERIKQALAAGFDDYFTKPVDMQQILDVITNLKV